jgi:hypothetical protein
VREKSDRPKLQLHHGPIEIERKFSVANDDWRQSAVRSVSIRDGLIGAYQGRKVRVRISGDIATLAIIRPVVAVPKSPEACLPRRFPPPWSVAEGAPLALSFSEVGPVRVAVTRPSSGHHQITNRRACWAVALTLR